MAITLSKAAAERVSRFISEHDDAMGLRLGVKKTGCSGYAYVIDYARSAADSDVVFQDQGIRIVVDRTALPMLDGTHLDFVRHGLNQSFKFDNPNVKDECGCGESFNA